MKGKKNLHFLYSHALYVVQKYGIILIFAKKLRLIMTNRYKATFLFAFLTFLTTTLCAQVNFSSATRFPYKTEHPLRETRAVWLTTIGGLDWPRVHAVDESSRQRQKAELISIPDTRTCRCALPLPHRALGTEPDGSGGERPWLRPAGLLYLRVPQTRHGTARLGGVHPYRHQGATSQIWIGIVGEAAPRLGENGQRRGNVHEARQSANG